MTTSPLRITALVVTLASVVLAAALLYRLDGDALGLMRRLRGRGETPYAVGVGWLVVAPVLFVLASSYVQVSTGPWVLLALVQLGVIAAVTVHLDDLRSSGYLLAAGVCAAAAFASLVAAAAGRGRRPGDF